MKKRSMARRLAFAALYAADLQKASAVQEKEDLLDLAQISGLDTSGLDLSEDAENLAYIQDILTYVEAQQDRIDELLQAYMSKRPLARISRVERAVLRLGLGEMLREEDSQVRAVYIHEAVEIAKDYGEESSYPFVNGLLDAILKDGLHERS